MRRLYSLHQHMFKVHLWSSLRSVSEGAWPVWQLAQHTPHAACSGHGTTDHRCTYATCKRVYKRYNGGLFLPAGAIARACSRSVCLAVPGGLMPRAPLRPPHPVDRVPAAFCTVHGLPI